MIGRWQRTRTDWGPTSSYCPKILSSISHQLSELMDKNAQLFEIRWKETGVWVLHSGIVVRGKGLVFIVVGMCLLPSKYSSHFGGIFHTSSSLWKGFSVSAAFFSSASIPSCSAHLESRLSGSVVATRAHPISDQYILNLHIFLPRCKHSNKCAPLYALLFLPWKSLPSMFLLLGLEIKEYQEMLEYIKACFRSEI